MGHRSIHKHKSRHRQHENKPPNRLQGARVVKGTVKALPSAMPLPVDDVPETPQTGEDSATGPE